MPTLYKRQTIFYYSINPLKLSTMENIQKPKNNLALTIVGTVLFWPISLWGLLKAVKVNRLWESGNHQEAIDASNSARKLGIAGIIVGAIFTLIVIIVYIVLMAALIEESMYGGYDDYYYY